MAGVVRRNPAASLVGLLLLAGLLVSLLVADPFGPTRNAVSGYGYGYNCGGAGSFGYGYNFSDNPCVTTTTSSSTTSTTGPQNTVTRLGGNDRIDTADDISQNSFPTDASAGAVVISRSDLFPDALAGTPFAVLKNAPILLTPPTSLDPRTKAELQRVLATGKTVYILGQTAAISQSVADQIAALGYNVVRIGDQDRFGTAVKIADQGLGNRSLVIETTGLDFPDALCGGAAATKAFGAVLLTAGSSQSGPTASYLAAHPGDTRYALGGPAANADPGATPIVGSDRYETCTKAAQKFYAHPVVVGIATGEEFPDGLTGGAHIARRGGPLLLTRHDTLPSFTDDYLKANKLSINQAFIYGQTAAISDSVKAQVQADIT